MDQHFTKIKAVAGQEFANFSSTCSKLTRFTAVSVGLEYSNGGRTTRL